MRTVKTMRMELQTAYLARTSEGKTRKLNCCISMKEIKMIRRGRMTKYCPVTGPETA
ncbi:MAG: hypothetical protein ACLTTJ_14195 [Blautia sp.]